MVSIVPADQETYELLVQDILPREQVFLCMVASDGRQQLGRIVCRIKDDTAAILKIEYQDSVIADGLVRAVLNSAREKGADMALCALEPLFPVLAKMGFNKTGSEMSAEINGILSGKCR